MSIRGRMIRRRDKGVSRVSAGMTPIFPAGGTAANMYALFHRTCGHAVMVGPDRDTLASIAGNLRGSGRFALRIRIATADDIESATRGITCNLCRALT